ncbi:MAG: CPBP family intramembrane glutamic endopeptidase [Pseudomonadota bacterium]
MTDPSTTGRGAALFDLLLIIGVLIGLKSVLLQIDAIWSFAGPISLVTALVVGLILLRRRGEGLSAIGFRRPKSIRWLIFWTITALVVTIVAGGLAEAAATAYLGGPDEETLAIDARYQGRFDNIPGNLSAYLFWIATAWIVGGFTEEMLFRGMLVLRTEQLLRKVPLAPLFAIALQAFIFGQQHAYYQGLSGWAATSAIAVVYGLFYLGLNRNLWPLILSHGLSNTIGLTLIYLGLMS